MRRPEDFEVPPGFLERTHRISREVTRHRSMEPQRSTLVTVQSRGGPDPAREGFDLASAKTSLLRASLTRQQPLIAQVDDMLPRRPQDHCRIAGSDQIMVMHATIMQ